jgi:signal transduction histidine kinase
MLSTILHNLISNAIKFTSQGGKVEIKSERSGDWIAISVTDTGKGISQQNIERLFKAGEKFKTTGTANEEGTGLGLILCKDFIELQGGKIWVESEEGCGSTFYLKLPTNKKV